MISMFPQCIGKLALIHARFSEKAREVVKLIPAIIRAISWNKVHQTPANQIAQSLYRCSRSHL